MRSDFGEVLLKFCLRKLSGCFIVESQGNKGIIYLIEGLVVHSEVNHLTGLTAFLQFFTWPSPDRFEWSLNMGAKEQTMALSYEAVVVMISYAENTILDQDSDYERTRELPYDDGTLVLEIHSQNGMMQYPIQTKQIRVGRSVTNDLVIKDPSVSRRHAFLTLFQNGLIVHDLGSANGTYVDGEAISLCKLEKEHIIIFGDVQCKLVERTDGLSRVTESESQDAVAKTKRIPLSLVKEVQDEYHAQAHEAAQGLKQ
ncbi:MAG: FHA domain-containing protein [Verrucomicrobiota bacterium]